MAASLSAGALEGGRGEVQSGVCRFQLHDWPAYNGQSGSQAVRQSAAAGRTERGLETWIWDLRDMPRS
jgi:hypothetical protein